MANRHLRKPLKRERKTPGVSVGNGDETDLVWLGDQHEGEDGSVDLQALLADQGYDPDTPLEFLLTRLVGAIPSIDAKERRQRVRKLLAVLTGGRVPPGPDPHEHYAALLEIAVRYHRAFHKYERNRPPLKPLIASMLAEAEWAHLVGLNTQPTSVVDQLARKFDRQRDLLLVRATSEKDEERMDLRRALRDAAVLLKKSGVPIDTA